MEWVNRKRTQYQDLPFWENMKRAGPYCETKEQKKKCYKEPVKHLL